VNIHLRPVTIADEPFEVTLFEATHRELFSGMAGLHEEAIHQLANMQVRAQRMSYSAIPNALFFLILLEGVPIGRYIYSEDEEAIHIVDIRLLPEYQSKGIGACMIEPQIISAKQFGKTIYLHVEKENVRARAFYERLGFRLCDGETESRYRMEWKPNEPLS
jgi:ribosomal protein S18 acetylase RimI-like enzyme